ncbi:hypothetical protein [Fictibacillus sp. FJAT-27399]|uniref:hypothetical protein n=1 Tax=Fictibacillus sp. FJAT-27399 TaxID=1729689 RepID=UPI00078353A7|nr:hypothetical protein [Fictibacillus sp. FJAT-27399]
MENFNPEFIKKLAMGDESAHEEIISLPLTVRMALGTAVDKMKRDENIVPMDGGKMSIYEQKTNSYSNDEEVANALAERNRILREAEERREQIRQEHLEREIKARVERARAGLTMNDRR